MKFSSKNLDIKIKSVFYTNIDNDKQHKKSCGVK